MNIHVRNLSFNYGGENLFYRLNVDLDGGEGSRPLVILGTSGCGKTTLLKLLGGLLKPREGSVFFSNEKSGRTAEERETFEKPLASFVFQEPRMLPWMTVLRNISLPLEREMGREAAAAKARLYLSLVSFEGREGSYPAELSGGQAQRVSIARAFAFPAPVLFMDEPFQSLDIPLRLNLMDLILSIGEKDNSTVPLPEKGRFLIIVTHDPREAIYMAGRIIILGKSGEGIIFDRTVNLSPEERLFGSAAAGELERELIVHLANNRTIEE